MAPALRALKSPNSARILRDYAVDAVLSGRVRVDRDQRPGVFGAAFFSPDSAKAQEEALLRGEAVDFFCGLAALLLGDHLPERGERNGALG